MATTRFIPNGAARWVGIVFTILTAIVIMAAGYGSLSHAVETNTENIAKIDTKLDDIIDILLKQP